jgi:hypothetical protein
MEQTRKKFIISALRTGDFQVRQVLRASKFGIASLNPKKVFTPDVAPYEKMTFNIDNPSGDKITGQVFNIKGEFIADLQAVGDATATSVILQWDGKGSPKGVYIYQITGDGQILNGTIVLAR